MRKNLKFYTVVIFMSWLILRCGGKGEFVVSTNSFTSNSLIKDDKPGDWRSGRPNLLNDCFTNVNFNACLIWKNPVAENGAPLSPGLSYSSNLSFLQIHAVNIDTDESGKLSNSTFMVVPWGDSAKNNMQFTSVVAVNGMFKFEFKDDPQHRLGQLMAFFWANLQRTFMEETTGVYYSKNKNILINSIDTTIDNAFFTIDTQSNQYVILGVHDNNGSKKGGEREYALSAEVVLHELGHSNVFNATNGSIFETSSSSSEELCDISMDDVTLCCKNKYGCADAINEGLADYHSAIIYYDNTPMGETIFNNIEGFGGAESCYVSRDVSQNRNLMAQHTYDACRKQSQMPYDLSGEPHAMGALYASMWWEVRKAAKEISESGDLDIDKIFSEHLMLLNGNDNFTTALTAILSIDTNNFNGQYSALFQNEWARRGL